MRLVSAEATRGRERARTWIWDRYLIAQSEGVFFSIRVWLCGYNISIFPRACYSRLDTWLCGYNITLHRTEQVLNYVAQIGKLYYWSNYSIYIIVLHYACIILWLNSNQTKWVSIYVM